MLLGIKKDQTRYINLCLSWGKNGGYILDRFQINLNFEPLKRVKTVGGNFIILFTIQYCEACEVQAYIFNFIQVSDFSCNHTVKGWKKLISTWVSVVAANLKVCWIVRSCAWGAGAYSYWLSRRVDCHIGHITGGPIARICGCNGGHVFQIADSHVVDQATHSCCSL